MNATPRVLVLDGQSNHALAIVRSLARAGYELFVGSERRWPLASWSRYCRGYYRIPANTVAGFADLRRWAAAQRIDIVLPLLEGACLLCNRERAAWEAAGVTIGCAPDAMLMRAFDKGQTLRIAESCDVRTPPTRYPESLEEAREAVRELGTPCVVKPRMSEVVSGDRVVHNRGIGLVNDPADADEIITSRKQGDVWPLIQGFVPGHTAAAFALCESGRALGWFAHESLRDVRPLASPSCLRRSVELAPRLREPAERLLAAMGWHGPAMVEFRDDGVSPPSLMEVNGRFWHSLQLAVAAGADFPLWWVRMLEGRPVREPEPYAQGVVLRWLFGDVKRCLYALKGPPPGYPADGLSLWQSVKDLVGRQPPGTRLEMWQASDPFPAVGEWVEGVRGVVAAARKREVAHA